jgi:hypothetical protein
MGPLGKTGLLGKEDDMPGSQDQVRAVVLAGRGGAPLSPLVRRRYSDGRPKQLAALLGSRSLLRQTCLVVRDGARRADRLAGGPRHQRDRPPVGDGGMRVRISALATAVVLAAGCARMMGPAGPRVLSPEPAPAASAPTTPVSPPPMESAEPPSPSPVAGDSTSPELPSVPPDRVPPQPVRPAPEVPATAPTKPAPAARPQVVAVRVPDADRIAQEVEQRVARAQEIIDKIDTAKLSRDQREILSSIQDFVLKARDAYQTKDMPRAQVLSEKASKLADDLAAAIVKRQ